MINERLRNALLSARLTPEDLATDLGVNPKTVERWVTQSRVPYPQFRHRISVLVQKGESYLWPDGLTPRRRVEVAESEVVSIYPCRADVPADLWAQLFENAVDHIGILVYSGFFLPEQHKTQVELLKKKADDGVSIRLLLGDPDSAQVAIRGDEEGIGDALAAKIKNVMKAYYGSHATHPGVSIKLHSTTLYNSIFWFDDEMLVNTHVYGVAAHFAPTLHLRRLNSGTLFEVYAQSFDRVWDRTRKSWTEGKVVMHESAN